MQLTMSGSVAKLKNNDGKDLIRVAGDSCSVVMSERCSIEQYRQELSFATDVIEKIKQIQNILADSSGDTCSIHEDSEGVELVVGAKYMNEYGKKLTYSGSGIFFDSIGMALTLSKDARKSLIRI